MIQLFLTASTQNITERDASYLPENPWVIADEYDGGWWVRVPPSFNDELKRGWFINELFSYGFSLGLVSLLKYAHDRNCSVVLLDMDADPIPGLELHEW